MPRIRGQAGQRQLDFRQMFRLWPVGAGIFNQGDGNILHHCQR